MKYVHRHRRPRLVGLSERRWSVDSISSKLKQQLTPVPCRCEPMQCTDQLHGGHRKSKNVFCEDGDRRRHHLNFFVRSVLTTIYQEKTNAQTGTKRDDQIYVASNSHSIMHKFEVLQKRSARESGTSFQDRSLRCCWATRRMDSEVNRHTVVITGTLSYEVQA